MDRSLAKRAVYHKVPNKDRRAPTQSWYPKRKSRRPAYVPWGQPRPMPQLEPNSSHAPPAELPLTKHGKLCPSCHTLYTSDDEEGTGSFCGKDGAFLVASDRVFAGKYLLGERLGFGQMSEVWSALQSGVGRQVALKILRRSLADNPEMVKRFTREAQIASSIDHPSAVTIFENGKSEQGQAYIAMEHLVGESLERLLEREAPMPLPRALELLFPVLRALSAAHDSGIVHRDASDGKRAAVALT